MSHKVFENVKSFLDSKNIKYHSFEHEKVTSSEHASKIREKLIGEPWRKILKRGAKAMIIKRKEEYFQLVLPGDAKINFKKLKKIITDEEKLDCYLSYESWFNNLQD